MDWVKILNPETYFRNEMKKFIKNFHKLVKILIIILIILTAWLVWYDFFGYPNSKNNVILSPKTEKISIGESIFNVEIVDSDTLRSRGLSGRKSLAQNSGMLFIFENSDQHGFWMKEMNFSIDIIWFSQDFKIVTIKKNIMPETYPTIFYPEENARYVLEINAGFSEKSKIKIGDKFEVISE